jgi:hypothetical protein
MNETMKLDRVMRLGVMSAENTKPQTHFNII